MCLPYMEYNTIYKNLSFTSTGDPTDGTQGSLAANTTQIKEFICPSNPNAKNNGATPALCFTNYKGMGATHIQSLAVNQGQTPLYNAGVNGYHPDGAMSPATANFTGNRLADLIDGTSHTILCVETIDNAGSIWTYGTDVTLVGVPTSSEPGAVTSIVNTSYPYYYPSGYNGQFDGAGGTQAFSTYLSFDFSKSTYTYPQFGMTPVREVWSLCGTCGHSQPFGGRWLRAERKQENGRGGLLLFDHQEQW